MSNNNLKILTPNIKKWLIVSFTVILGIKLGFIVGDEVRNYKKSISRSAKENIVHLESIKSDRAVFFGILRDELIEHLKNGTSVDLTVSKFNRELSKPSLQTDINNRHEILILSTSSLLATKNYAINHSITKEQLKSIQTLFKTYISLKVEFSAGVLKKDGILFVPNKIEVEDFLSPVYNLNSISLDRENMETTLKDFKKL